MKIVTVVLGFAVFAPMLLVLSTTARAIPCSPRVPGQGLAPSVACLNGAPGDDTLGNGVDYAFDLNVGAYFGFSDWSFLQLRARSPTDDETVVDAGLNVDAVGNSVMGSWLVSPSIWADYDNFAVILKADVAGEDNIFWSTYLLQEAESDGTWFSGRPLASFSMFGRTSQVSILEPGTWSLMLAGLITFVVVWSARGARFNRFGAYFTRSKALPLSSTSVTASAAAVSVSNRLRWYKTSEPV